jgi:hypothetical protein
VKREALFELVKELATLHYITTRFSAAKAIVHAIKDEDSEPERQKAKARLSEESRRYQEQLNSF